MNAAQLKLDLISDYEQLINVLDKHIQTKFHHGDKGSQTADAEQSLNACLDMVDKVRETMSLSVTDLNEYLYENTQDLQTLSKEEVYKEALHCSCLFIKNAKNWANVQTGVLLVFDWFLSENDKCFLRWTEIFKNNLFLFI